MNVNVIALIPMSMYYTRWNFADLSKALVCMESGFIKIDDLREKTIERIQAVVKAAQG